MSYKIESGIAIPARMRTTNSEAVVDIIAAMNPGDSVQILPRQTTYWLTVGRRRFGYKMTSRKLAPTKARVWRVE